MDDYREALATLRKQVEDDDANLMLDIIETALDMLEKSICGTNTELSKAWDKIEKLQDDANILQCLREAGIDNVEAYSQGMHIYFERYPEQDDDEDARFITEH